MKKAEMEEHRNAYHDLVSRARAAESAGSHRRAVELAMSCWDHIDGMMQYERKYEDAEFKSIAAIDIVLKHAPLLLDLSSLSRLESLLKECRRIEKQTSVDLVKKLGQAQSLMWDAHRAWDYLEFHPEATQDGLYEDLGGDRRQWDRILIAWETMGLVQRSDEGRHHHLALCTRMGKVVGARCPSCGSRTEAPKAMFLEELSCPTCNTRGMFVILAS